jgi:hypothetical protein
VEKRLSGTTRSRLISTTNRLVIRQHSPASKAFADHHNVLVAGREIDILDMKSQSLRRTQPGAVDQR